MAVFFCLPVKEGQRIKANETEFWATFKVGFSLGCGWLLPSHLHNVSNAFSLVEALLESIK
jgi:hypothetical protein